MRSPGHRSTCRPARAPPQASGPEPVERSLVGHEKDVLDQGLGDEQAIEGILAGDLQAAREAGVTERNREGEETFGSHDGFEVLRQHRRLGKCPEPAPGDDFHGGCRADEHVAILKSDRVPGLREQFR